MDKFAFRRCLLSFGCALLFMPVLLGEDVEVGKAAPDFTMTGVDGKDFKLSDVTSSGKNVALMFSRAHW